jgi:hypothetical protein
VSPEDRRKTGDDEESSKDAECGADDRGELGFVEGGIGGCRRDRGDDLRDDGGSSEYGASGDTDHICAGPASAYRRHGQGGRNGRGARRILGLDKEWE